MTELLTGILGLVLGSLATTFYLGNQIKELKNIILDKRTIVNLLKRQYEKVSLKEHISAMDTNLSLSQRFKKKIRIS